MELSGTTRVIHYCFIHVTEIANPTRARVGSRYSNADLSTKTFIGLVTVLTAPVYATPFVILPLFKKCFFA